MTLREQYPLHPNKIVKKTISYTLSVFVLLLFVGAIGLALAPLVCLPLIVVVPVAIYFWQKEYYKTYFYDLDDNGLEIRKGVFFPRSITIPHEKVSDIYVDQDILDRIFGLYDLHFSSASATSGAFAHIDGMDKKTTDSLRAVLVSAFKSSVAGRGDEDMQAKPAKASVLASFKPAPSGFWSELAGSLFGLAIVLLFIFPLLLILLPVLAIPLAFFVKKEFDARAYEIRSDGVWIRKGWLAPSETMLFYRNIQDTEITESLFERLFGLQSISVKSMSAISASSAKIVLLSTDDAKKIQEMVRQQIELGRGAERKQSAMRFATGASAPQAAPIEYKGPALSSPYKSQFFKGHLAAALPLSIVLLLVALCLVAVAILFGSAIGSLGSGTGFLFFIAFLLAGAAVAISALSLIPAAIDNATYSYEIGEAGLSIQVGLISRYKKVVRYEKIQDIQLHCGFIESFFGLASVHVATGSKDYADSGSSRADVAQAMLTERVPFLPIQDAHALRAKLMEIAGISYPQGKSTLREACPLSPKKPLKKTAAYVGIFSVQLFIVSLAIALASPMPISLLAWGVSGLFVLFFISSAIIYKYEELYMQKYFYNENDDTLTIHKGVFGWNEIVVPFRNIQSIYVDQDWFDVYFDLWDVWITTVTATSGPMAHIDGVSREDAEKLARLLAERTEKSRKR